MIYKQTPSLWAGALGTRTFAETRLPAPLVSEGIHQQTESTGAQGDKSPLPDLTINSHKSAIHVNGDFVLPPRIDMS